MKCKLCNENKPLVKAHIIPESFFRNSKLGHEIQNKPDKGAQQHLIKRRPIGKYDKSILCQDCEHLFQNVDNYASDFLIRNFSQNFKRLQKNGRTYYVSDNYDFKPLVQFFQFVLWRAHASKEEFFRDVDVGKYYNSVLIDAIQNNNIADHIRPMLYKPKIKVCINPKRQRDNGINYYDFTFGKIGSWIKVDKRIDELWIAEDARPIMMPEANEHEQFRSDYIANHIVLKNRDLILERHKKLDSNE